MIPVHVVHHRPPPIIGYAYVCNQAHQTEEIAVRKGEQAVVVDRVGGPSTITSFWQIFHTASPSNCVQLTEVGAELTPGAVLVAVTWSLPYLVLVSS